jgi:D-alanine-D-alanine ligase
VARALREWAHEVLAVDTGRGVLSPPQEASILDSGIRDPHPPDEATDLLRTGDLGAITRDPRFSGTDVVFPALHGGRGEDGTIQALLQLAGLPFVGSDRIGSALAMDKDLSKRLLRDAGIPTPPWITVRGRAEGRARLHEIVDTLGLPLIVKPPSGGSTLGLSLVHEREALEEAMDRALLHEELVLFEGYVRGREVTVGILGEDPLPVGEIIPKHEIFDYECKYRDGMAQEIFPADLPPDLVDVLQSHALATHRTLRLRDFSRVDFILDEESKPWCLEANSLPGLTGNSLLPKAAKAAGISFPAFCNSLAERALARARNPRPREGV